MHLATTKNETLRTAIPWPEFYIKNNEIDHRALVLLYFNGRRGHDMVTSDLC